MTRSGLPLPLRAANGDHRLVGACLSESPSDASRVCKVSHKFSHIHFNRRNFCSGKALLYWRRKYVLLIQKLSFVKKLQRIWEDQVYTCFFDHSGNFVFINRIFLTHTSCQSLKSILGKVWGLSWAMELQRPFDI